MKTASSVRSNIVKIAAVLLLSAMLFAVMFYVCSADVGIRLFANGRCIGAVNSADDVNSAIAALYEDLPEISCGADVSDCKITYGFVLGKDAENVLSYEQIYRALYIEILKDHRSAYGVYANGEFIGANTEADAVASAVSSARAAAQGAENDEVELVGSIEVKGLYYPESTLKAGIEIAGLLTGLSDQLYRAVPKSDEKIIEAVVEIGEDDTEFLSAAGTEVISSQSDGNGVTVETVRITEQIQYSIVYEKSDELYVGQYEKKCDGKDGKKESVFDVTYENGEIVSYALVSEEIVLDPTAKVIYEGTKIRPTTASTGIYDWPIKDRYTLTDTYGYRYLDGKHSFHYAIDIATSSGIPIYAADGGVVVTATRSASYGNYVLIRHDNGQETLYAHMRKTPIVSEGERVYRGQQIGEVGMTGYATGPHLHFEIRINGERVNPLDYLP